MKGCICAFAISTVGKTLPCGLHAVPTPRPAKRCAFRCVPAPPGRPRAFSPPTALVMIGPHQEHEHPDFPSDIWFDADTSQHFSPDTCAAEDGLEAAEQVGGSSPAELFAHMEDLKRAVSAPVSRHAMEDGSVRTSRIAAGAFAEDGDCDEGLAADIHVSDLYAREGLPVDKKGISASILADGYIGPRHMDFMGDSTDAECAAVVSSDYDELDAFDAGYRTEKSWIAESLYGIDSDDRDEEHLEGFSRSVGGEFMDGEAILAQLTRESGEIREGFVRKSGTIFAHSLAQSKSSDGIVENGRSRTDLKQLRQYVDKRRRESMKISNRLDSEVASNVADVAFSSEVDCASAHVSGHHMDRESEVSHDSCPNSSPESAEEVAGAVASHSRKRSSALQHEMADQFGNIEGSELPFLPKPPRENKASAFEVVINKVMQDIAQTPLASEGLPLCPRCQAPTRQVELDRFAGKTCHRCYREIHLQRNPRTVAEGDWSEKFLDENGKALLAEAEIRTRKNALLAVEKHIAQRRTRAKDSRAPSTAVTQKVLANVESSPAQSSASNDRTNQDETPRRNERTGASLNGSGTHLSGRNGGSQDGGGMNGDDGSRRYWCVRASERSLRTVNPIRELVQGIAGKPNPEKSFLDLSVGDPTTFQNMPVSDDVVEEFCRIIREQGNNGYTQSMGALDGRAAVARRYSIPGSAALSPEDVILTSGVSGALELALGALVNEGDNVLLPRPGFPLFRTMLDGFGAESRYYSVLPDRGWEVNVLEILELADARTAAIVINNPSNPCGSVFSEAHIRDIVQTAAELCLPIIADEVYADMVFSGHEFVSVASVSQDVPVLSVGGLSKQYAVPGWRLGWLLVHDRHGIFDAGRVRTGIRQLTTRMLMPNAPSQAMLPFLLANGAAADTCVRVMATLERNAGLVADGLNGTVGLRCVQAQGSMYMMVGVDVGLLGFEDDLQFAKSLRLEEAVFVLPGQCFQAPNFVRIVFAAPPSVLVEATNRIKAFCERHAGRATADQGSTEVSSASRNVWEQRRGAS